MSAQKPLIMLDFPMLFTFFSFRSFEAKNARFKLLFFCVFHKNEP